MGALGFSGFLGPYVTFVINGEYNYYFSKKDTITGRRPIFQENRNSTEKKFKRVLFEENVDIFLPKLLVFVQFCRILGVQSSYSAGLVIGDWTVMDWFKVLSIIELVKNVQNILVPLGF